MHITDLIYLKKNQKKNRTHQRHYLWVEGTFFVLDAKVGIIFLLLLLSLVKSKWWMNSDLSKRNREVIFSFSVSQYRVSLFLFLSSCLHSLSLDFIASLFLCLFFYSFSFLRVVIFCFFKAVSFLLYQEAPNSVLMYWNIIVYRF